MLSWPPATTMVASPVWTAWAASATARRPEPQTWLTPQAGTSFGTPAAIEAWRAGFWPWAAVSTWPRITSETSSAATPAWASAASIATRPSSCAGTEANEPRKDPTGVRLAAVMTMSVMGGELLGLCSVRPEPVEGPSSPRQKRRGGLRQAQPERGDGLGGPLAACRKPRKPCGERFPQLVARLAADHHADMAEREVDPLARPDRAPARHDPVGGRDDVERGAGKSGRADRLAA